MPLLGILLGALSTGLWFNRVDLLWYKSVAFPPNLSENAAAAAVADHMLQPGPMVATAVVGGVFAIGLSSVILAAYFMLTVRLFRPEQLGFRHWIAFAGWSMLPSNVVALLGLLTLMVGDVRHAFPGQVDPLALNFWLNVQDRHMVGLIESVNLSLPLTIAWNAVGLSNWTGLKMFATTLIAFIPVLVYFGCMLLLSSLNT